MYNCFFSEESEVATTADGGHGGVILARRSRPPLLCTEDLAPAAKVRAGVSVPTCSKADVPDAVSAGFSQVLVVPSNQGGLGSKASGWKTPIHHTNSPPSYYAFQ